MTHGLLAGGHLLGAVYHARHEKGCKGLLLYHAASFGLDVLAAYRHLQRDRDE